MEAASLPPLSLAKEAGSSGILDVALHFAALFAGYMLLLFLAIPVGMVQTNPRLHRILGRAGAIFK